MSLAVETIRDPASFAALAPWWDDLLEKSGARTVFLTHAWLLTWLEHYGGCGELRVVLVREGGVVVAAAPLFLRRREGIRLLATIGQETLDYEDFLLARGCDVPCAVGAVLDALLADGDWDQVQFNRLPESSATLSALQRLLPDAGLRWTCRESELSPYVKLAGGWEAYYRSLPKKFRENARRRLAQLRAHAGQEMFCEAGSAGEVETAIAHLFRLHRQRRKAVAGDAGLFASAATRAFYRDLALRMLSLGRLRLSILAVDGAVAAVQLNFEYAGACVKKAPAFDDAYGKYGVGDLLNLHVLRESFERGLDEVDFLRGDEGYKFKFRPVIRRLHSLVAYAPTARGAVAGVWVSRIRPALRSVGALRGALRALRSLSR